MQHNEFAIPRALSALKGLASAQGAQPDDAITFALTWLAATRMVLTNPVLAGITPEDLSAPPSWEALEQAGLPLYRKPWWGLANANSQAEYGEVWLAGQKIVQALVRALGSQPWDVLPSLTSMAMHPTDGVKGMVGASVADLMLDLLGAPKDRRLWIPFDRWGVLTLRAVRRGWRVHGSAMLDERAPTVPLLLAIEFGAPQVPALVDTTPEQDPTGRLLTRAECILACPPVNVPVRNTSLSRWDSSRDSLAERYVRSETWVVNELLNRTEEAAVFLLPPGVLFSRGQEQSLRKRLLHLNGDGNALRTIVTLPGGAWSQSNLSSAVVMVTPQHDNVETRMVDLGLARRSAANLDRLLPAAHFIIRGSQPEPRLACQVRREAILRNETSMVPSRYLSPAVSVGENALPLRELCEAIRAPATAQDGPAEELLELGIPEMGEWAAVGKGISKVARVRPRATIAVLQPGDLVLSIKGTIGKTALVGTLDAGTVVSQSCLGLRLLDSQRQYLSPAYLLMYLRSEAGQAQLEAFQAGATIPHVSPQTLLNSFLVPLPDAQTLQAVENDYQRLCELEEARKRLQQQMSQLVHSRWPR